MSAVQRRAEAIATIEAAIHTWGDEHGVETGSFPVQRLAQRLFELPPAYCPHDSSCHDEACPCGTCDSNRSEGAESELSEYNPPCGDPDCRFYHCGRCDEHTGQTGHYTVFCGTTQTRTAPHHCCPSNCALAHDRA